MTRIFDNIGDALAPALQQSLTDFLSMDAAVGYFNLRGWGAFSAEVTQKAAEAPGTQVARVLIGMVMPADPDAAIQDLQRQVEGATDEDIDHHLGAVRREALVSHLRHQLMRGLPTAADRETLRSLKTQIESGAVHLKVYTRRPLHGKLYLFHRNDAANPRIGFVGSSNLTQAGLTTNYELNVDVVDHANTRRLSDWFEKLWADTFAYDIDKRIIELIEESWAFDDQRRPYDVYLKLCYDLSKDIRDGLAEYDLPSDVSGQLLDYQRDAVKVLARRLRVRGGTMLGDVVGLGKTLTAVAVARLLLEEEGYWTLVVCPKNLQSMWKDHLHAYGVPGEVVPYSMAAKVLPTTRKHRLVIVDESHTLRSDTRQDYLALHQYIRDYSSKVLLLTATPYNVGFKDVANQIALYLDEDSDLGLQPSAAIRADPTLVDKVDGMVSTLRAFRRSQEPEDWKRLMSEHLVRRTRSFIKRQAEDAGQIDERGIYLTFANGLKFHFPQRIATPLDHTFGPDDPATLMTQQSTLDAIGSLKLPRYDLRSYVKDKGVALTPQEQELLEKWKRGRGQVKGFVMTNFLKRLSSCGHSFILSLQRHADRNRLFAYALENGLDLPTGTLLDAMFSTDDTDADLDAELAGGTAQAQYEALRARNPESVVWVRAPLFSRQLLPDLESDTVIIKGLLARFGAWSPARDSKLAALKALLQETHPHEKVLVFSEYKDTADYVGSALVSSRIPRVAVATGDSEDPTELARRFAPIANRGMDQGGHRAAPLTPADEVRVLIATDVLSEGQNLQDAHIVVNYDLPWAIIKLIQRAGRVDRIGQASPTVTIYSMFHDSVENELNLRRRIRQRLEQSAAAFGADEQFFGDPREVNLLADVYNADLQSEGLEEEVDAATLAHQVWRRATKDDQALAERIVALPDLVAATKAARPGQPHGVACMVRTHSGMDAYGLAAEGGALSLMTGHEILSFFACEPEALPLARRHDHDEFLACLVHGEDAPLARPSWGAGQLRGVRKGVWSRLSGTHFAENAEIADALDALIQNPLTDDAERRLRKKLKNVTELAEALVALHNAGELVVTQTGQDPIRIVSSMGVRDA